MPITWAIPALFIGLLSAWRPLGVFYKLALKDRYGEYPTYLKLKYGFDSMHWERPFYVVLGGLCAVFVGLTLDWYAVFGAREIVVNGFWSVGQPQYSYSQIRVIRASDKMEAPNGNVVNRWTFVIDFDDGYRWGSRWDPSEAGETRVREIAEYVARQSGRTIEMLPMLRRADQ